MIIFQRCSREDSLFQTFYYPNAWNRLQRRKEWICESSCQVSDRLHFFAEYFDLNPCPSATTVYAQSAFCTSLRFTLSLQTAVYTQSAFYPWSAVRSLRFTLTALKILRMLHTTVKCKRTNLKYSWNIFSISTYEIILGY